MSLALHRRAFIAAAGAATASAARAEGRASPVQPRLAIFDAALPPGRAFAARAEALGMRTLGLARDGDLRAAMRAGFGLSPGQGVIGLTRWADWVILRGDLAETGRRVRREARLDGAEGREGPDWPARLAEIMARGPAGATLRRDRLDYPAGAQRGTLFAWAMA